MRLEADGEWLGAEDRVYPVTIDPVVSTPCGQGQDQGLPCLLLLPQGITFTNSHLLKTGHWWTVLPLRSYMKFELPYINRADR